MRRILSIILCFSLLCFPRARAEATKYVALTFDDGPSGRFTRRLLQGLEERQVQATFLLCGYRLKIYPKLAQQIFDAGHDNRIGSFYLIIYQPVRVPAKHNPHPGQCKNRAFRSFLPRDPDSLRQGRSAVTEQIHE